MDGNETHKRNLAEALAALQGPSIQPPKLVIKHTPKKDRISSELAQVLDSQFVNLDRLVAEIQALLQNNMNAEAQRLTNVAQEQLNNIKKLQKISTEIISELN